MADNQQKQKKQKSAVQKQHYKMPETNQSARKIWIECGLYGMETPEKLHNALWNWSLSHVAKDGKVEWFNNSVKYTAKWSAFYNWIICCCESVMIPIISSQSIVVDTPTNINVIETPTSIVYKLEPIPEGEYEPIVEEIPNYKPLIVQEDYIFEHDLSEFYK